VVSSVFAFSQNKKAAKPKPVPPSAQKKAAQADQGDEPGKENKETPPDPMSSGTFEGLKLRPIGPAMISGRVLDFAVDPKNHARYFIATASGGVWKTENDGITWVPLFDSEGSYSIATVVLDSKDSNIVWVGSGESNSQRSVGYGDGVYRSDDGGKSWKNMGLKKSEHIGRIAIDPRDSNVVFVAAEGPLWAAGGERGLYKTTDGGKTWKNVLHISDNTGVVDVAIDSVEPNVMYAASYQRRRHVWTLIDGGPESAIYKSTDGGENWNKLKSGLPSEDLGRVGLAISPADHNVIYATIEAANKAGGIFRSRDRGATWEKRNDYNQTAMYYGQIYADPKNVERIYVTGLMIKVSNDGGKTIANLPSKSKHVDNHVIWIDPDNTDHYLVGCDGGVYESYDRAANWEFKSNLPLGQFYDVAVDNALPFYNVYGGTQDNNNVGGPSRTTSASGITNADWFVTQGGDGFRTQVDPEDPNTVYAEYQEGVLTRYNKQTGERTGIMPQESHDGEIYRWDWDSPIIVSPHSHTRLYFGANKVFRSDNRGDTWQVISPDLTRQIDRNSLSVMGKVWEPDAVAKNASTSFYGNIVALSESPKKEGLLYAGTDDGLLQVTEDGGGNWRKLDKFPGVPDSTYVSRIAASHHDANTVYAAFENHKNGDFKPYLLKSTDAGRTWSSVAANLPENGPVLAFAEDPDDPNLLFAGTEFGCYFTIDGGKKWIQLKGNFPTIAVRDLVIQARESDLVVGTFGRSIYILDDITLLRRLKPEQLSSSGLFAVRDALLYHESRPYGGRAKAHMGEAFYIGENPPFGATITYYLKEKLKTKRDLRHDAEKEAAKKGKSAPYPTADELRAEDEEEPPAVLFTISDEAGHPLRILSGATGAGLHRLTWDLRYPAPVLAPESRSEGGDDFGPDIRSPLVMPGAYKVSMATRVAGTITLVGSPVSFTVTPLHGQLMSAEDRAALTRFQRGVASLYRSVNGAAESADQLKSRIQTIKRALLETPTAAAELIPRATQIEAANNQVLRILTGDQALEARNEPVPPSIQGRVSQILDEESTSSSPPTNTHLESFKVASQQLTQQLTVLRKLIEVDLAGLEKDMETAGAPWTPGRIPTWEEPKF
jgi:photosystem II stability/assembly factor-like uncharacterized protein